MSLDRSTRNALAAMVGKARERLKLDVMDHLRRLGFQDDGTVLDLDAIGGLSEGDRAAGQELRALLEHFAASEAESGESSAARRKTAYDRLAREIGFTTLNRLVALRMAEERGLIVQSVGDGLGSRGFQVYERVAGTALGSRVETYRAYLECLYDEIARDLPVLFDRTDPQSRIFPGERCLENVLAWLNDPALANLWNEDETIGWVYQYYNDPDERKKMRESQAPRTSRELAVRNQFFTPRYVVEFLTDNTLGRLWYEMRQGDTRLVDQCAYLVRRKHTVFLAKGQQPPAPFDPASGGWGDPDELGEMWTRPNPDLHDLHDIMRYALTVGGYAYARRYMGRECDEVVQAVEERRREKGKWEGSFEELRCTLFARQRAWHHWGYTPEGDWTADVQALYRAVCGQWDLEAEYVPYRAPQPPRRIKLLDPACGSCHFLLYAFDLLATMYQEAEPALPRHEIPARILQYNLHGIDIDPRAVQIAGLALYLKARKYDREARVAGMNIVCAAPMPGEHRMFEEFLTRLDSPTLARLADAMWDELKLAGVAGSLLKPEQRLREVVAEQRKLYQASSRERQLALLPDYEQPEQLPLDFSDVTDDSFWDIAEEHILAVLRDYSEQADGDATTRRLFAEDSMQGFRFVDLMRKRYDVVLMNPPFGLPPNHVYSYIVNRYPSSYQDLAITFMSLLERFCSRDGMLGAITTRAYMLSSDAEMFRRDIVLPYVDLIVDLGLDVMDDAWVEAALQVLNRTAYDNKFIIVERRHSLDVEKQAPIDLLSCQPTSSEAIHFVQRIQFTNVPKMRIAFDTGSDLTSLITDSNRLAPDIVLSATGLRTFDDDRFYRLRWEVAPKDIGRLEIWCHVAKNTEFAAYYYPSHVLVRWKQDGRELAEKNRQINGQVAQSRQGSKHYFRPGLTFSRRSEPTFTVKIHPSDSAFSSNGGVILPKTAVPLPYLCGLLNSTPFRAAVQLLANKYSFTSGHVEVLAWQPPADNQERLVTQASINAIEAKIELERNSELDLYYVSPHECSKISSVDEYISEEGVRRNKLATQITDESKRIDGVVCDLYGISIDYNALETNYRARITDLARTSVPLARLWPFT